MCGNYKKKFVGGFFMDSLNPTVEISTLQALLLNFDWKIVKQEITDELVTLTIVKDLLPHHPHTQKVK